MHVIIMERLKGSIIVRDIFFLAMALWISGETATTSKEGSRRANYPIPTRGGSDKK
jgi:hypothetical protein